jgi:hypothetical protein
MATMVTMATSPQAIDFNGENGKNSTGNNWQQLATSQLFKK